jgi:LPXTG-site transpeptidase (sortase) family protein
MLRQHRYRHLLVVALVLTLCSGVIGCGTLTSAASTFHPDGPLISTHVISPTRTPKAPPTPQRLLIPSIGVNALIERVGIVSDGDLETPQKNPWVDTGWYNDGPLPGQQGSSVIDGHLDRPGGYPAVFWYLRNVEIGDQVEVINSNGKKLFFRVTDVEYYPPTQAPLQEIFGNSGGNYLNLITCAGDWIPSLQQTTLREVVYSTLISK